MVEGAEAVLFDFGGTLDTDGTHWGEKPNREPVQPGLGISG